MSLQIWLPLNGDLHNQGLSNLTVTNNGATVNNSGKIGKCYQLTSSSSQKITIAMSPTVMNSVGSLACWVKFNSLPSSSGWFCLMQLGASGGFAACRLGMYLEYASGINISINGSSTGANYKAYTFTTGTWYHICAVYDGTNVKLYINGTEQLNKTASVGSYTTAATTLSIGGTNNYYANGCFNDARYYNHALSPKEVEEISKGLVLHYKLDYGGIGNLNMLTNTHFDNRYSQTSGWDTAKNGTLLANQWGGYNSGVSNASTVYHAHLKELNGEYVYEFIRDANNSWLGISQGGLQNKLTAGKTYTFSWEQFCVSGSNYNTGGLYYYKTGATSANFHLGSYSGSSGKKIGEWQRFSYTFTAPSDGDYSKSMAWYIYGHVGGSGTIYTRRPKLEEGAVATPWAPAMSDPIYNIFADNFTTVYDCSGYSNDGTIVGSLTAAAGSPRYEIATVFNGDSYSLTPSGSFNWWDFDKGTFCTWMRPAVTAPGWSGSVGIAGDNDATKKAFDLTYYANSFRVTYANTSYKTIATGKTLPVDEWHFCAATIDGNEVKIYFDGELITTSTIDWKTATSPSNLRFQVGVDLPGTNEKFNGSYSDVRFYSTVLSATTIKELYDTSVSIDAFGNIYARELKEV